MPRIFLPAIILLAVSAIDVYACKCVPPPAPKEAQEQAQAVCVGNVTKLVRGNFHGVAATLEVTTTWKGTPEKTVTTYTGRGDGDCGYGFKVGQSYLVYAYLSGKEGDENRLLRTNICTRTRPLERADEDIEALGPATMPP